MSEEQTAPSTKIATRDRKKINFTHKNKKPRRVWKYTAMNKGGEIKKKKKQHTINAVSFLHYIIWVSVCSAITETGTMTLPHTVQVSR